MLDRYHKRCRVSDNVRAVRLLQRVGIAVFPEIIMFDPWTTRAELQATCNLLARLDLVAGLEPDTWVRCLQVCPGTPLWQRVSAQVPHVRKGHALRWHFLYPEAERVLEGMLTVYATLMPRLAAVRTALLSQGPRGGSDHAALWAAVGAVPAQAFQALLRDPGAEHQALIRALGARLTAVEERVVQALGRPRARWPEPTPDACGDYLGRIRGWAGWPRFWVPAG